MLQTNMEEEEFQSHKESLIASKQGIPTSLYEESERYWEQIWNRRYVANCIMSLYFHSLSSVTYLIAFSLVKKTLEDLS